MPSVLVTGASRGIGLELARQYAADDWQVIACARAPERAHELQQLASHSRGELRVEALDVTDFVAIDALAKRLAGRTIDVLINCAGSMGQGSSGWSGFGKSDLALWDGMFRLNTYAPLKMAEALVTHVAASGQKKIINLSTVMASLARNTLGGFYAYRASKAALNAITVSLAVDLGRRHGILAAALHPGWVRTDMGGPRAEIDARTSVTGLRQVIAALDRARSGRFWSYDGTELPW
ncbi:MAG TPA: SDR family oxidoreductase [Steroidobacteraceae bacterium]|nr:SDR family oxidoreductase [Steroidobacteraceae bacterium]